MKVETYECEETKTEIPQESEEAIKLINELNLEGQQGLIKKASESTEAERCPYRKIRADELFVYQQICPQHTRLVGYSEAPIPLRVLQVISHAQSLGIFKCFEVWSAQGLVKDPVLLASTDTWIYENGRDIFILARWADELEEFGVLLQKAIDKWKEKAKSAIAKAKSKAEQDLAIIDSLDLDSIVGQSLPQYDGIDR